MTIESLSTALRVALPLYHAYKAYKEMYPGEIDIKKTFSQDAALVKDEAVLTIWEEFLENNYGSQSILVQGTLPKPSMSIGCVHPNDPTRFIGIDTGILKIDRAAALWLCKHEQSIIDQSANFQKHRTIALATAGAAYATPEWNLFTLSGITMYQLTRFAAHGFENDADVAACKTATEDELKGAIRYFTASIEVNKQLFNTKTRIEKLIYILKNLAINYTPSDEHRLSLVEKELQDRFEYTARQIEQAKQSPITNSLKRYMGFRKTVSVGHQQFSDTMNGFFSSPGIIHVVER